MSARRLCIALALAAGALVPAAASAQPQASMTYESERNWVFEIEGTKYTPQVDSEAGLHGSPFTDIFGKKKLWLFSGELDYELWQKFGTLSAALAIGYGAVYGHGILARTGTSAADVTVLKTVPIRALATYRFDWLARSVGIPLVPYAKFGPSETLWWVTNGRGDVATFGSGSTAGKAWGGKWGYELAAGLAFELNFLDPTISREFDQDFGVNHVFVKGEYLKLTADNFGKAGLDLSGAAWNFGLGFEF